MITLAVVCEAEADFLTASTIIDRVICHEVEWIDTDTIEHFREYRGIDDLNPFCKWSEVKTLARQRGIIVAGFMNDVPAFPDAHTATKAIRLFDKLPHRPDVIALVRDSDNDTDRRKGLKQAREASPAWTIIIGFAHTERECWLLACVCANTDEQNALLDRLRQELGFHPCVSSERLVATKDDQAVRSPKRVWNLLCEVNIDAQSCLANATIQQQLDNGRQNGLADFLIEIQQHLIPRFGVHRSR